MVPLQSLLLHLPLLLGDGRDPTYDLRHPDRTYILPDELLEVSALTDVNATTVACLQDEEGRLYLYDLMEGRVTRSMPFAEPGDYEGLTRVGAEYFALRSDGLIHRMVMLEDRMSTTDTFRLKVPNRNIEGLGYDEPTGRVLVTPKDFIKDSKESRDVRKVFAFDPRSCVLDKEPALTLSVASIIAQAEALGCKVPMRTTDKGRDVPAVKLRLSSIAVHPITGRYHLLSAADRIYLVLERNGTLVDLQQFDADLFPKPEGITFLPGGDLLISNEGKDARPNLLRFAMRD